MAGKWSVQVADFFHLNLPDDVIAWFDSEIWREESSLGYGAALEPEEIPRAIAGGAMLPDTLPILGNWFGDYLCLRIHPNGSIAEAIGWLHEGAVWTPYGNTLCEALLFDAALDFQQEASPRHLDGDRVVFANWALERLSGQTPLKRAVDSTLSFGSLLAVGLAEVAIRSRLCKEYWTSGLLKYCREVGGQTLAKKVGVKWSEFHRWRFDTNFIPDDLGGELARAANMPVEQLLRQDWERANREAERVGKLRTDLVWPFAVMGWAAERQGKVKLAAGHYLAGMKDLQTSADFTEDWVVDRRLHEKFLIERLNALREILPPSALEDGYLQAALAAQNPRESFEGIRGYWITEGEKAEAKNQYERAYWCYYGAGWDLYCYDDTSEILTRLARTASSAGWPALSLLARAHLEQV